MEGLQNPLKNIRKPSGSCARDRRLKDGEYDRIYAELHASGNRFAAHAFVLAIETSLRKGALFCLRWEWVDLPGRMVRMPAHARGPENKEVPPALPLSRKAVEVVTALHPVDEHGLPAVAPTGLVLDTTPNAVMCVWKRILPVLGIEDLRWHDLRHEAASRLFEKGLNPMEVATITGHKSMQMLRRYTHLKAENLIDKLG